MDVREKLFTLFQDCNNPSWKWFPNNAEMLKLIDYLIAHGVTVQECKVVEIDQFNKWISVKDRLPKSMDWVLCICVDGKFHILRYDYISGDWDIYKKNNCCYGEWFVTHWMPMPNRRKENDYD